MYSSDHLMEINEQLVLTEERVVTSDQLMQTDEVVINQSNVSIHDNFPTQNIEKYCRFR